MAPHYRVNLKEVNCVPFVAILIIPLVSSVFPQSGKEGKGGGA